MTLGSPDSNDIGRYAETTSLSTTISALLNLALASVSAAFTKYVRTRTVYTRASGTIASGTSFVSTALTTAVIGTAFTRSGGFYICQKAGTYRIKLSWFYQANATGNRGARLLGSGSIGSREQIIGNAGASFGQTAEIEWIVTLAVNDTINTQAYQNSGSALDVSGSIVFDEVV